jgi:hypothetical protein
VSDFVNRFEFDEFRAVTFTEFASLHAKTSRPAPVPKPVKGRDAVIEWRAIERKTEEIAAEAFARLRLPKDGQPGKDGIGIKGDPGKQGGQGKEGPEGPMGPMPDHRWNGTKLAFEKPDGTYDDPVDLQGPPGTGGAQQGLVGGGTGGGGFEFNFFSYQPAGFL